MTSHGDAVELGAGPPAVLVDRPVAPGLEVLLGVPLGGVCLVEGVGEAGAVHRFLLDPVHRLRLRDARGFQDRRADVGAVGELRPAAARVGDPAGPGQDHAVAGAAQVRADLLAPLERGVPGPRPRGRVVRRVGVGPPRVQPAVLAEQGQLLIGGQDDAAGQRHLVERAGDGAFQAGPVVAEDVEDQRVIGLAHLRHGVQQPPGVVVGVLLVAGVDLHLPGVQLLLVLRQRVPGGEDIRAGRQHRVRRDHAELLLPLEGLLPQLVPALVELAPVLLAPLDRDMVRRVRAAGGVVHEPWLGRVLRADRVQPPDRLAGHGIGQVELLAVLPLGDADDRVVLRDQRVKLPGLGAQEPPEMVKSPAHRPAVVRARRALHVVGGQVPLAEPAGGIAVLLQHPGERRAGLRHCRRVAGERPRQLADRAEPHRVVVMPGQHRRPRR